MFCTYMVTKWHHGVIFSGLERRRFALPQKFVSLQSIDIEAANAQSFIPGVMISGHGLSGGKQDKFAVVDKKIGFFYPPQLQEGTE